VFAADLTVAVAFDQAGTAVGETLFGSGDVRGGLGSAPRAASSMRARLSAGAGFGRVGLPTPRFPR
jgi:hypothetical protein